MEQTTNTRARHCKRPSNDLPPGETHRRKMAAKKIYRAAMLPGFTPVTNQRISARFDALTMMVALQNPALPPHEISARAHQMLRSELPHETMVRRTRFRPVNNDNPVYRKQATERRFVPIAVSKKKVAA